MASTKVGRRTVRRVLPQTRRPKGVKKAREKQIHEALGWVYHSRQMLCASLATFEDYLAELPCYGTKLGRLKLAAWRRVRCSDELRLKVASELVEVEKFYLTAEARHQARQQKRYRRKANKLTRRQDC